MALSTLLARFRASRPDSESVTRVKAWVREGLGLDDDAVLTVNEIACTDPACPGLETVILVMRPGAPTQAYKARGSIVVQTRPAIRKALAAPQE